MSLSLCNFIVLYISLINRNCVLLYICASCYIHLIYLCYIIISLSISQYIYLLYLCSHFVLKIIQISGIRAGFSWSFFSACPQRGLSIASWVLSLSLLRKIALACPRNPPWRKKIKMTEQMILLICCLRKLSCDKGMKWWRNFPTSFNACR